MSSRGTGCESSEHEKRATSTCPILPTTYLALPIRVVVSLDLSPSRASNVRSVI